MFADVVYTSPRLTHIKVEWMKGAFIIPHEGCDVRRVNIGIDQQSSMLRRRVFNVTLGGSRRPRSARLPFWTNGVGKCVYSIDLTFFVRYCYQPEALPEERPCRLAKSRPGEET